MRIYSAFTLGILAIVFLSSCGSTGSQEIDSPASASSGNAEVTAGETAEESAEAERQRALEEQQALAAERERQQAAARRAEEEREAQRRAEEQRLAEARAQREAEEAAQREAQRQRELAAQRAAEQARIVAAQQARIEELRAQIDANADETDNIEAANAVLRRAVQTAEELTDALMTEEEKYNNTDPATGEPVDELATARLERLAEEVEDLNSQAEDLLASP